MVLFSNRYGSEFREICTPMRLDTIEMWFGKSMLAITGTENAKKLWRKWKEKGYLYITLVEISGAQHEEIRFKKFDTHTAD